jgi:hypothetical protein
MGLTPWTNNTTGEKREPKLPPRISGNAVNPLSPPQGKATREVSRWDSGQRMMEKAKADL